MKVIVATYGTEGDARPFAALCRGLMDAGHEARLLADAATLGSAQALGVPTTALAGDIRGTFNRDHAIAGVVSKGGGFNTHRTRAGQDRQRECRILAAHHHRSRGRLRCDPGSGAGRICRPFPRPNIWAPGHRLRHDPDYANRRVPFAVSAAQVGAAPLNRASHRFVNAMLWKAFRDKTNAARAMFKLPPRKTV